MKGIRSIRQLREVWVDATVVLWEAVGWCPVCPNKRLWIYP